MPVCLDPTDEAPLTTRIEALTHKGMRGLPAVPGRGGLGKPGRTLVAKLDFLSGSLEQILGEYNASAKDSKFLRSFVVLASTYHKGQPLAFQLNTALLAISAAAKVALKLKELARTKKLSGDASKSDLSAFYETTKELTAFTKPVRALLASLKECQQNAKALGFDTSALGKKEGA